MNRIRTAVASALGAMSLALVFAGCRESPAPPAATPPATEHGTNSGTRAPDFPTNVTAYDVKGVLKETRANGMKALIAHEDIPGFMEAMTMLLDVRRSNDLAGLTPGDAITFRMLVTETDGWIDRVKKVGSVLPSATEGQSRRSPVFEELEPGAPLPDCVLTNQAGKTIRLSDYKGQVLAFTFIFTRCPFPTMCPRMNQNFIAAQKALAAPGLGTNWQFLSISFDPDFDTPERLARYAQINRHDPAHWTFATGATDDVRRLGGPFGLAFWREGVSFNHNVRTVVVAPDGRIHKAFPGNEWKPEELAAEMKKLLTP